MYANIYDRTQVSLYQPSEEVRELTRTVQSDYQVGQEILDRPWQELNGYSVIARTNKDQRTFNALVDESTEDPAEAWKFRGTRSTARKKTLAMHAQLTANYIIPGISAQNEFDEEDREMSEVMRTILEWMVEPTTSNYQPSFLLAAMGMLVNPVTFMGADYCKVYQDVKKRAENGTYTKEKILDEVLSGFQANIYGPSEILIRNAFIPAHELQRQPRIIKRRWLDYSEAQAKYGDHPNWPCVQKGVRSVFNADDNLFYDVKDDSHPALVEECTWMSRRDDAEVCFVGGIYMGDAEVDANPMKHRGVRGEPKYDLVAFGYRPINEHFFYYKSFVNEVGWDDQLLDAMYELIMNRGLLDMAMPVAVSGVEVDKVSTDMVFPGSVVAFANDQAKVQPLLPPSNMGQSLSVMREVERSMGEFGASEVTTGGLPDASQKAYTVAQATQNAKTLLQGVAKSLGTSIAHYGALMVDIAVNHVTVPEVEELLGSGMAKLKYRQFIVNGKTKGGRSVSKKVRFDPTLIGADLTEAEVDRRSLELLQETGYPEENDSIIVVNPEASQRMKYLVRCDPEELFVKNDEYQKALMSNLYAQLRQDPLIDPETLVRMFTYAYFKSEGEALIAKPQDNISAVLGMPQGGAQPGQNPMGDMAQNKALSTALGGPGGASPAV